MATVRIFDNIVRMLVEMKNANASETLINVETTNKVHWF
jgi:hypothetical protein